MANETPRYSSKEWLKGRRTHSVHDTHEEARAAAFDLGRLMNGTPFGYVFIVWPKMGKFAFVSMPADTYRAIAA